ncbi:hypothetical protein F5Y17DRAFT_454679 [Xylariaceae sp. FL0594]|nr:hypothetical protein F5Y17DRAFT_454679 [Xylariaceae sp. FL0594]
MTKKKGRYFAAVEQVKDTHKKLAAKCGVHLLDKVMNYIASFVPPDWEVGIAREPRGPGRPAVLLGDLPRHQPRAADLGLPIHSDWAPYDTKTEN